MTTREQPVKAVPGLLGVDKRSTRTEAGNFVRQVRLALGMDQESFADVVGVRRMTVIRWETGYSRPNWRALQVINTMLDDPLVRACLKAAGVRPYDVQRSAG